MDFKSKKTSLLILVVTAFSISRLMFVFFDDPEGTNLLVTTVTATIVYCISLIAYKFNLPTAKKFWLALLIQMLTVVGLYICLS